MYSKNLDWLVYSNYWRKWSRVLLRMGGDYPEQVELSLQPNNDFDNEWAAMLECRIRKHRTVATPGDRYTHNLPERVYYELNKVQGTEVADFFVHADIYNMIDWEQFKKVDVMWTGGGGIPLILVAKDINQLPYAIRRYWDENGKKIGAAYYEALEKADPEEHKRVVRKTFESLTCDFRRFISYISDERHVWDKEKYVPLRSCNGNSFNLESAFQFQYCVGNAFAKGRLGDFRFMLFKDHQGFVLHIAPINQPLPTEPTFTCGVDKPGDLIKFVRNTVSM